MFFGVIHKIFKTRVKQMDKNVQRTGFVLILGIYCTFVMIFVIFVIRS